MKKFSLYSFFSSYNIGDVLIAKKIKDLFSHFNCDFYDIQTAEKAENCRLKNDIIFDGKLTNLKSIILNFPIIGDIVFCLYGIKSTKHKIILEQCSDSDIVIFAGGNLVMELKKLPSDIIALYRTIKCLKKNDKKVYLIFCGIGPFKSYISKIIAKKIFNMVDFISVRDTYSLNLVKGMCQNKIVPIWCDPVLISECNDLTLTKRKAIGLNIYFGNKAQKNKMCDSFVSIIKNIRKELPDYEIYLFSSELTDYGDIKTIKNAFINDNKIKAVNIMSADELFNMYSEMDVLLGTRMHTIITATISGLAVVSISWQEKVKSLAELLNNIEFNFSVDDFANKNINVFESLKYCLENSENIRKENFNRIKTLKERTMKEFNQLIVELEK